MSLALNMVGCMGQDGYPVLETTGMEIAAGGLEMSVGTHRVKANGTHVLLGPTEFRILFFFMTHAEWVFSRTQLLDQVWGKNAFVGERTVDVHIHRLRAALEPFGLDDLIQTVRERGYRFSSIRNKPEKGDAEVTPGLHNLEGAFGDPRALSQA